MNFRTSIIGLWLAITGACVPFVPIISEPAHAQETEETAAKVQTQRGDLSLEQLLQAIREGRSSDNQTNRARIQRFEQQRGEREAMLAEIKDSRARLEGISAQKESTYEEQDLLIGELEERLQQRMASR